MTFNNRFAPKTIAAALALSFGLLAQAQAAVVINIVNGNAAGVGFNDTTPAAPVGGNTGTTLGEQRLIAFTYAANIWGNTLTSAVPININATFEPLTCTATGAVLGSAGAWDVFANFPNAPKAGTWYPTALANKLSGTDLSAPGDPNIRARFNSRLGLFADCLPGPGFYLGLDNNHGAGIDFVTVLLHEMGHGLGFQTFTSGQTGAQEDYGVPGGGIPSVWDHFMQNNRTGKLWVNMSDAERMASGNSGTGLSWVGAGVTAAVPSVLSKMSQLGISGANAGAVTGNYTVGDAAFGTPLSSTAVTGQLMPVVDQPDGSGTACGTFSAANALAVKNNIALIDRGVCTFAVKAKNAQNAGAIGVVLADNRPEAVFGPSGSDPTLVIPVVEITQADGVTLKSALKRRTRTASGVIASLGKSSTQFAGTDSTGHILLYTPVVYEPGSSVSHYTTAAFRNQLMEPAINDDLLHTPLTPYDLTFELLKDIGW